MNVDKLLADAVVADDFRLSVGAARGNAKDTGDAVVRFLRVSGAFMVDPKADRASWAGSPEEELVDRCLHEAEVCMAMATTAVADYMKRTTRRCAHCGDRCAGSWCGACNPQEEGFA